MANDYGLKCPKCGQDTKFDISARHTITVDGEDIDHDDSLTWDSDDTIECGACGHEGTVESFDEDKQ